MTRDIPKLVSFSLGETGINEVYIKFTVDDNLTGGFIKRGAKLDIIKILKEIDVSNLTYDSVLIEGTFPLADIYGNSKESRVFLTTYSSETVNRINWDGFNSDNIYLVAEQAASFIHPAFKD